MGYMFAVVGFLMILVFNFTDPSVNEKQLFTQAKAINFIIYRNAVHDAIFQNEVMEGNVQDERLFLPSGFIKQGWSARIENETCYVYGIADIQVKNHVKELLLGSHSIGEKKNNYFYPQHTDLPFPIPAFISESSLLSIMEVK